MRLNEFKLERFFAKFEFKTPNILCASDCEPLSLRELLTLNNNSERFFDIKLGYTESLGTIKLREAISSLYSKQKPDNILTFSGAQEGIFVAMNVLLKPLDHIVVQSPAYQSLYEIAYSLKCRVTKWYMEPDWINKRWTLDLEHLKESISKKTKAIVINFPHNPTGAQIPYDTLKDIVEIANDNNLYIFSDEVYRFLEYSPSNTLPAICDLYPKGLSLGVMSKAFGLAGLRIGWITTHDIDILTRMAKFKDFTTICNSTISESLATIALNNKEYLLARNLSIIRENIAIFSDLFHSHPEWFSWIRPLAGSVAYPRLNRKIDIKEFCSHLIEDIGVLLLPGTVFQEKTNHFRIGLGRKNIIPSIELLRNYIEERS